MQLRAKLYVKASATKIAEERSTGGGLPAVIADAHGGFKLMIGVGRLLADTRLLTKSLPF